MRCGEQPSSDSSLLLQVLALCLQLCGQPLKLHWVHKVRDWGCLPWLPFHLQKLGAACWGCVWLL